MEQRERLGSRLGFIMLSAGCAIGCGNVWKFPWMCGQFGGGGFVLVYIICLLVLGLPVMTMEFAVGRAAQASPIYMYQRLEKKGQKWHLHGYAALVGNAALMAFYTVVTGWIIYYFVRFLTGKTDVPGFISMATTTSINVTYMAIAVVVAFIILCFNMQKGLEKITNHIMIFLLSLMILLMVRSFTLSGAKEGLRFYLVPDFTKINGKVIVAAMNQAFFTLSIGQGSMAIFGSYIGKERSLMGESVNVIVLDTVVAVFAGLIMFPACFTYGVEVSAGPGLLFDTMATVFNNMVGGRLWGTLFFLFMVFAAMSTVLAVCENLVAMVREMTGWSRPKASIICAVCVFALAMTTALSWGGVIKFEPFAEGSNFMDFWDFIVSTNVLPLGSFVFALFCCNNFGWGWDHFLAEANAGTGLKVQNWMKPVFRWIVPVVILFIYIYGLITFNW